MCDAVERLDSQPGNSSIEQYCIRLTPYARVLYEEWVLDPLTSRYNMLCADHVLYDGLDIERLRYALYRYVADHLVLNSHIRIVDQEPCWVKNNQIIPLEVHRSSITHHRLLSYINQPFDLLNDALYRFKLVKIDENRYRFIAIFHHLLMDGVSLDEGFFHRLSEYYRREEYSQASSLSQQIERLQDLQKNLSSNLEIHGEKYRQFWSNRRSSVNAVNLKFLQGSFQPEIHKSSSSQCLVKKYNFYFDEKFLKGLTEIKKRYRISSYFYSLCIFAVVLYRYTNQANVAFSYPIGIDEGADFIFGAQVNLSLISFDFTKETRILDIFHQAIDFFEKSVKEKPKFAYYPISEVINMVNDKQLLNVCFAQTSCRDTLFHFDGVKEKSLMDLHIDGVQSSMVLLEKDPSNKKLHFKLKYDGNNFDDTLIETFIDCYKRLYVNILEDLLRGKNESINNYSLLSEQQMRKMLCRYDSALKSSFHPKLIHCVFENQVLKTPNHVAIKYSDSEMTYSELNENANQIARYLLSILDIEPDNLVALYLDKSNMLVSAILAVLKISAAYVPIADCPQRRLDYIIEDTQPKIIITESKYCNKFGRLDNVVVMDSLDVCRSIEQQSKNNVTTKALSHHLAYVIYTSGSTGEPKGVMQTHENLLELFSGGNELYQFTEQDVWVLFHSYAFDFSIWEIFGALLYGGKLVIPTKEEIQDGELFHELCCYEQITILNQTPSAFYAFMNTALKKQHTHYLKHLRYIIFGGEKLNFSSLSRWFKVYSDQRPHLVNMYGVTETTVVMTYKFVRQKDILGLSTIGRPISGKNAYILDENMRPVPIGAIGELYASGGVARGYLNKAALTAQSFISAPFFDISKGGEGKKLYKTGDLVRMLPDGELEFIGRRDFQVKVRGYRIELGEIENVLISHPCVEQAVVLLTSVGDSKNVQAYQQHVVAYYVLSTGVKPEILKTYVEKLLPQYMCPSIYHKMVSFPITENGKVDIKALPTVQFKRSETYQAPENIEQKLVCDIFSTILLVRKIGIDDDFFELGGNSIKAINLVLKLQEYFDVKVADIFRQRTPRRIVANQTIHNNLLISRLLNIKKFFNNKMFNEKLTNNKKLTKYLSECESLQSCSFERKPIKNVLLTGATGFLGCHLLNQLLQDEEYTIYILSRNKSKISAADRLEKKYQYYFSRSLEGEFSHRVHIIEGDIEKPFLGLKKDIYISLSNKVDSIVHAAALVKHYGNEAAFHSSNVDATRRLLEFSSLTKLKDFHYISTCSVAYFGQLSESEQRIFTEDDTPESSANWSNIYNQSKYLGEKLVLEWRNQGLNVSIYRVGNLVFDSKSNRLQDNICDNAFYNCVKFIRKMGCVPELIARAQVSQVDLTAKAVILLFNKGSFNNGTYHIFNPNFVELSDLLDNECFTLNKVGVNVFIDLIIDHLSQNKSCELIAKFLLYQGWLERDDIMDKASVCILQNKTEKILSQLGFAWPEITQDHFKRYSQLFE